MIENLLKNIKNGFALILFLRLESPTGFRNGKQTHERHDTVPHIHGLYSGKMRLTL
jgi:hypothetical protein